MTPPAAWYAQLAKSQPDLFRLIHDFNVRPQHWVHPQRLETLPHRKIVALLSESRHGHSHASRWVARQLNLDQAGQCWDFLAVPRRLALLGWETLEKLAAHIGAAVHAAKISSIIAGRQIAELKAVISPAAHAFALRRGKAIPLPPAALSLVAPASETLPAQVLATGWTWIFSLLADAPAALLNRFALKLPVSAAPLPLAAPLAPVQQDAAWGYLQRVGAEGLHPGRKTMLRLNTTGISIAPARRILRSAEYASVVRASEVVTAAQEEAAGILARAGEEAARIRLAAQEEFDRRHAEGHHQGMEEGRAEISQQIVECMSQSAAYFSKVEGVMVDLVMRAVRRVLGTFEQKEIVTLAVQNALSTTRNEGHVTVRVAPAQAEWLQGRIQAVLESCPKVQFLEVLPDGRLPVDGCVVETEIGVVDASIQTQLRAIEKALVNSLK